MHGENEWGYGRPKERDGKKKDANSMQDVMNDVTTEENTIISRGKYTFVIRLGFPTIAPMDWVVKEKNRKVMVPNKEVLGIGRDLEAEYVDEHETRTAEVERGARGTRGIQH